MTIQTNTMTFPRSGIVVCEGGITVTVGEKSIEIKTPEGTKKFEKEEGLASLAMKKMWNTPMSFVAGATGVLKNTVAFTGSVVAACMAFDLVKGDSSHESICGQAKVAILDLSARQDCSNVKICENEQIIFPALVVAIGVSYLVLNALESGFNKLKI